MLTTTAHAEKGILILNVKDTKDRPIAGVRISTEGDGSTGPATDPAGKTEYGSHRRHNLDTA